VKNWVGFVNGIIARARAKPRAGMYGLM
jgi:hypothetical protein